MGITKNPIFIVGYMHSGTSLLQKVISNHSAVYSPRGEIKFIEYLTAIEKEFPQIKLRYHDYFHFLYNSIQSGVSFTKLLKKKKRDIALSSQFLEFMKAKHGLLIESNDHLNLFFSALDYFTSQDGKSHWLEKSPNNIFYFDDIIEKIPNAKFINIIRDPRDVLASKKTRSQTVNSGRYKADQVKFKKLEKKYSPLIDSLSWKSATKRGFNIQRKHPQKFYIVKYEDIVNQPEMELKKVFNFLDLPYEADTLNINFSNAADSQLILNGISNSSVSRYKKVLSVSELGFIEHKLRIELMNLNIERKTLYKIHYKKHYIKGVFEVIDRLYARYQLLGFKNFVAFLKTSWRKIIGRS